MEISGIVWLMQSANDINLLLRLGVLFTFQSILFRLFSIHHEWGLRAYCMPSLSRVQSHTTNHLFVTITLPAIVVGSEVGGEEMKMQFTHSLNTATLRKIHTQQTFHNPQCPLGQTWKNLNFKVILHQTKKLRRFYFHHGFADISS